MTKPQGETTLDVLHNMSVPPSSRITLARARFPGLRFGVSLAEPGSHAGSELRDQLAKDGWRAAWRILDQAKDAPSRAMGKGRRPEALEQHLKQELRKAGIPDRLGVFLDEELAPEGGPTLTPAAAMAVLARRSGPLYLPSRRLEPSLVDPIRPLVLFFPEESR
jgi:hypothetical protein